MRIKAANGIGPVACNYIRYVEVFFWAGNYTVIASESCFARGVDHCLVSVDDHLTDEQGGTYLQRGALRTHLRA